MNIRKFSSNTPELLDHEPAETYDLSEIKNAKVNVLGLQWNTLTDCFEYNTEKFVFKNAITTKREVLSTIAKIYDPLGWCSPVVIQLKIFMQKLWLKGLNWEDELTQDISLIKVPRWCNYTCYSQAELHGFSDASELAYAAAIYIRIKEHSGTMNTTLIAAKTRVAPVKQISLPRLELCGAHLLSKLITKVKSALHIDDIPVFCWSDSSIVLAWLGDHPRRWKSFVANRTSQILEVIPASQWLHIPSKENPADLATRGLSLNELKDKQLWWCGPTLLQQSNSTSRGIAKYASTTLDERKAVLFNEVKTVTLFEKYSNLTKLIRITAYLIRFKNNTKNPSNKKIGFLKTCELNNALEVLIINAQHSEFQNEIDQLIKNKQQLRIN